jgi:hypothetical protein
MRLAHDDHSSEARLLGSEIGLQRMALLRDLASDKPVPIRGQYEELVV